MSNGGALRGVGTARIARPGLGTRSPGGDGSWLQPLAPFEGSPPGSNAVPWCTGRTSDLASTAGGAAVATPFYSPAGATYSRVSVRFHSATTAGVVYVSLFTWDWSLRAPVGSVLDIGSATSYGAPGTHFYYNITATFATATAGWYAIVQRATGETITWQAADAVPFSADGGAAPPNNPANCYYQSSAVTGATYCETYGGSGDGVSVVPLVKVLRDN